MSRRVVPLVVALLIGLALAGGIGAMLLTENRRAPERLRGAVAGERSTPTETIRLGETPVTPVTESGETTSTSVKTALTATGDPGPETLKAEVAPSPGPGNKSSTRRIRFAGPAGPAPKSAEELAPERRAGLRGRFVDSKGRPIPGLAAKLTPRGQANSGPRMIIMDRFIRGGDEPKGTRSIKADKQGRWTVEGLDPDFRWSLSSETTEEFLATRHRIPTPRAGSTVDCGDQKVSRPGSISGVVLDPSGRPVPGARVRVASGSGDFPINFGEPGGGDDDEEKSAGAMGAVMVTAQGDGSTMAIFGEQWENTRADASGRFTFKGLKPGPWTAFGEKKGFRRGRLRGIQVEENRETRDLRLMLAEPGRVVVTVKDHEGRPLAGAGVELTPGGSGMVIFTAEPKDKPKRRTDGNGELAFDGLGAESYTLVVEAEGFARVNRSIRLPADQPELRVTVDLTQGVTVALRVVNGSDGTPVPGARVMLTSIQKGPKGQFMLPAGERYPVDAQGLWRRGGYAPGKAMLAISAPGFQSYRETVTISGDGPTAELGDIRLTSTGRLDVVVLDADGKPIQGARVSAGSESGNYVVRRERRSDDEEGETEEEEVEVSATFGIGEPSSAPETDVAGRVTVENIEGSSVTVKASKEGLPDVYVSEVNVPTDGSPGQVTLRFSAPGKIRGRALGKDGEPLAKSPVMLFVPGWSMAIRSGRTDTEGNFVFEGLSAGTYQVVMTEVSFFAGSKSERLRLEPGAELQHDVHKSK